MELATYTKRIGWDGAYRDVVVHEMLDSEVRMLRHSRWLFALLGFLAGWAVTAAGFYFSLPT